MTEAQDPAILVAEGTMGAHRWRQYFVITDRRCAIVEMTEALLAGWRFHRVTVQGEDDWTHLTRDQIVRWKLDNGDYAVASDLGDFRATLIKVAQNGVIER